MSVLSAAPPWLRLVTAWRREAGEVRPEKRALGDRQPVRKRSSGLRGYNRKVSHRIIKFAHIAGGARYVASDMTQITVMSIKRMKKMHDVIVWLRSPNYLYFLLLSSKDFLFYIFTFITGKDAGLTM